MRGEVWWADLGPPRGSGPAFSRPVVIVSADDFNVSRIATVTVAIVTSNTALGRVRGNVMVPRGTAGLDRDSVVNVSQLATIDKSYLGDRVGALPRHVMDLVDDGLRLTLAL